MQSSTCIVGLLTEDALLEVTQRLQLKDRIRFVASSKALWQMFWASASAWQAVELDTECPVEQECFGSWLLPRRHLVRRLALSQGMHQRMPLDPPSLYEDISACTLATLGSLAGGPLAELEWSLRSGMRLGSWAFRFPALRRLQLTWMCRGGHLSLSPDFGHALPQLTHLSVEGVEDLHWPAGCLPPSLLELRVADIRKKGLVALVAGAAEHAAGLQSLVISSDGVFQLESCAPWDLDALCSLTALTHLELLDSCSGWPCLGPLERLPSLRSLSLCFTGQGEGCALSMLSRLTALSRLGIDDCSPGQLGAEIWGMPNIKVLDLRGMLLEEPLPAVPLGPGLQQLSLSLLSAINVSGHLSRLQPLTHLVLDGQLPLELHPDELVQVVQALRPMPSLRQVDWHIRDRDEERPEFKRALEQLRQERPQLAINLLPVC